MGDGNAPAHWAGIADGFGGGRHRWGIGCQPTQWASGAEDGPAVDHMTVLLDGFAQGEVIETAGHGTGRAPVGVDEQWLVAGHAMVAPHLHGGSDG